MAKLNLLLTEFSEQHHLGELSADEKGIYRIIIDEMEIECFEKIGKGYFCSKLTALPKQTSNLPVVLKNLMNHALLRTKSHRCSLALEKNGNLVLFERFDIESMNLQNFSETLEKFSNALEEYRHFIDSKHTEQTPNRTMLISP